MESIRATAIRVCGAATLVVVGIALVEIATRLFGLEWIPSLQTALGAAVLVSLAAFLVANAPRRSVAEGICLSSVAVIAVLGALRVYESGVASLNFADAALALCCCLLLGELCRHVLARRPASAA